VIGMPIWEALNYNITPQTKRRFRNVIEQAAQGDFIRYEGHMTDIKLETIVVDYSLKPVKNSSGEVTLIIAEGRDITERKRMELALENEQQRLYTLLDSLPAFVALQSLDYSVRFANQRFHQRFGDPADKLCYQLMFGFSEPCQDCLIPEVIEKKEPRIWEKTYPDGKSFQIYGYPFYDKDQTPMVLELGVDITENKKAQAKIQQNAARAVALSETIESILEISPEYQGVLEEIVHSTAGLIGDGCVIRLISADRMTHRPAAFHHVNRETRRLLSRTLAKDVQPLEAGASGQVIRSGQPLFVPSIQIDQSDDYNISTHPTYLVDHHLHSLMCMPLRTRGDLIGTLTLFRDKNDRPYTQEDFLFVQNLSDQAALAIQNARLFEAELKARQTAEILRDASLALTQSLDLATVVNLFLDFAKQLAPYDWARVFLIEDETHLKLQAERGPDSLDAGQTLHFEPVGSSIFNDLLSDKQSILIPDTKIDSVPRTLNRESAQSWLGIPLAMEGHAIGLCIFESSRPGAFSEHHVQLLKALVGQVTVVIQNAWLFEQVRSGRGRLQSLSRKLVEVQESERRYVARELHDEASQALASLMVGLRLIERDADNPDSVLAGTGELKILTEKVMENLHRLAMDLRPASLDHLGLVTALRQYAKSISDRHHLLVQFEAIGVEDRLAADMETAIYRVVQEALSNVIRHAQATRVDVILEIRDSKLVIIVEDNGVGFNPLEIDQTQRLGLLGMRERVDMLEGTLTIESELGVGTTLFVEVPYGD
jgi:signal transduction histidine kinase/PAS domain-containing protein